MKKAFVTMMLLGMAAQAQAENVSAVLYQLTDEGQGRQIGTIVFEDTDDGLFVTEKLSYLSPGTHGIHVHERGDCGNTVVDGKVVLGGAAGGHYDPEKTGKHLGPDAGGHKGDLPALTVKVDGTVDRSFFLQSVTSADLKGRSVIIHAGGDNYQDEPLPLGGGGDRIACGIIKAQDSD